MARDSKSHRGHNGDWYGMEEVRFVHWTKMYCSTSKCLQLSLPNSAMEHSAMATIKALEETVELRGTTPPGHPKQCPQAHFVK